MSSMTEPTVEKSLTNDTDHHHSSKRLSSSKQISPLLGLVGLIFILTVHNSNSLSRDIAELKSIKGLNDHDFVKNETIQATTIVALPVMPTTAYITRWERAIIEAKEMLANTGPNEMPPCLLPNKQGTLDLVDRSLKQRFREEQLGANTDSLLSLPVLNLGMPKMGSTTLAKFFWCVGMEGSHQYIGKLKRLQATCMRDAARLGMPPLKSCAPNEEFLMQMDAEYPFLHGVETPYSSKFRDECFFPQLELLESLHDESPNATFIMNFRPIDDWIKSMKSWNGMVKRFSKCNFPNMPQGLPKSHKQPEQDFTQFLCSHVLHARHFVEEFPSHSLIELDLYDQNASAAILSSLFPNRNPHVTESCWGQANVKASKPKEE